MGSKSYLLEMLEAVIGNGRPFQDYLQTLPNNAQEKLSKRMQNEKEIYPDRGRIEVFIKKNENLFLKYQTEFMERQFQLKQTGYSFVLSDIKLHIKKSGSLEFFDAFPFLKKEEKKAGVAEKQETKKPIHKKRQTTNKKQKNNIETEHVAESVEKEEVKDEL